MIHRIDDEDMLSELELLVMMDMSDQGYDPYNEQSVNNYWKERLDD